MHSMILFLSDKETFLDMNNINTQAVGIDEITDYVEVMENVPNKVYNFPIKEGVFEFTKESIENYFSDRFMKFKQISSCMTLSDFCSAIKYDFRQLLDCANDVYVVVVDNDSMEYIETFDSFVRWLYEYNKLDCKWHMVGCLDYHK